MSSDGRGGRSRDPLGMSGDGSGDRNIHGDRDDDSEDSSQESLRCPPRQFFSWCLTGGGFKRLMKIKREMECSVPRDVLKLRIDDGSKRQIWVAGTALRKTLKGLGRSKKWAIPEWHWDHPRYCNWINTGIVGSPSDQGETNSCWEYVAEDLMVLLYARKSLARHGVVPRERVVLYRGEVTCNLFRVFRRVRRIKEDEESGTFAGCIHWSYQYAYARGRRLAKNYGKYKKCAYRLRTGRRILYIRKGTHSCVIDYLRRSPLAASVVATDEMDELNGEIYSRAHFGGGKITHKTEMHAVILVGFAKDEKTNVEYFIAQTPWGDGYEDNGCFKVHRNMVFDIYCPERVFLKRRKKTRRGIRLRM